MQITFEQANRLIGEINPELRIPSQHPTYLLIDAKREKGLEPIFFAYEENGHVYYHAFLMGSVLSTTFHDIQSPYGYGGAVSTTRNNAFLDRAWSSYRNWCNRNSVIAEFMRFHPLIRNWEYYPGEVLFDRETVWVDLTGEDLLSEYGSKTRNMLRKAMKNGLNVEWSDHSEFFSTFPSLYEQLMAKLQASSFYLFPKEYYKVWSLSNFGKYAICKIEGQIVGAAVFYLDGDIMEYHLSASNEAGKKYAANTLLLHEAGLLGKQLGCKKLHLGGGTNHLSDNPLFIFKTGFSSKRSPFHIGKYIHLPEEYKKLKSNWGDSHKEVSNRVLFYR